MAAPQIYVRTQSVKLPVGGGGDGTLEWCSAYPIIGGTARYRIFKVSGFSGSAPTAGTILSEADVTLVAPPLPTFNRNEFGYAWTTRTTTIPNLDGGSNPTPNGLYAIQIREQTGAGGSWSTSEFAYFVIRRAPTATDKVLLCYPFSTTVAYAGNWGDHDNLYDSFQWQRSRRVTRDRPLGATKHDVTVEFPWAMEQFIRAHDSGSLGVDVCTSFDLEEDPDLLDDFNLFVSVGHDEYWSKTMSDKLKEFVEEGGNAAFFSANTAWWQVRFENSGRTIACFKGAVEDGETDTSELTGNFCSPPSIEENTLTGVSYRRGTQGASSTPFTVLASTDPYGYLSGVTGTFGPTDLPAENWSKSS